MSRLRRRLKADISVYACMFIYFVHGVSYNIIDFKKIVL